MTNTRHIFLVLALSSAAAFPVFLATVDNSRAETTANPNPNTAERAAAKTGNEIDEAIGPNRPVTAKELKSGISLDAVENPAQALATAQIKNRQGQAIGTVSAVDVAPDGKAQAIHVDVGGFLGIGEHRVAIRARNFVYLKSRDLLVTTMTKDQIKALRAELPPHG
jgi:hypothetical protein